MWRDLLARLAGTGKVFAQWRVASGVTFYMYVPSAQDFGTETIAPGSDVRFDELVTLDIKGTFQVGALKATNNVAACREALEGVLLAEVSEVSDGIRVALKAPPAPTWMVARPWSELAQQPISDQLIRNLFPFEKGYRFFPNRYDAGVKFLSSVAQPLRVYVFEGECTYRSDSGTVRLKSAEYADLLRGEYEFEVPAAAPIRLMKVFKMPEALKQSSNPAEAHPDYGDSFASGARTMDILIAEDRLPVGDALLTRLVETVPEVRWRELDEEVRVAYARKVALLDSEMRSALGVGDLTEPVAFYNAYYWALMFAKRYKARYGFDAGIEQEAFKVLECAPADVDWQVVERVNQVAQQA